VVHSEEQIISLPNLMKTAKLGWKANYQGTTYAYDSTRASDNPAPFIHNPPPNVIYTL
jgi:hypothetical protein